MSAASPPDPKAASPAPTGSGVPRSMTSRTESSAIARAPFANPSAVSTSPEASAKFGGGLLTDWSRREDGRQFRNQIPEEANLEIGVPHGITHQLAASV